MKTSSYIFTTLIVLVGCAGGAPKPIQVIQSGDYSFTCEQLTNKINSISTLTSELDQEDTSKYKKNIGLATAGSLLIVPYFFMDLTEGDNIERNAARARYIHLHRLAVNKKCSGFDQNAETYDLPSSLRKLEIMYENGTLSKDEYLQKRKLVIENYSIQ